MAKKQKYEIDSHGNLRKKGFLSGLYNFGYYYKSYIIVALVAIAFGLVLHFSLKTAQADMYLFLVTHEDSYLTEENVNDIFTNARTYVDDFDKDGTAYFVPKWIRLSSDKTDASYSDLNRALEDENVICFAVDKYSFEYLRDKNKLRELSFFGLEGMDDYRIRLRGSGYMKNVTTREELYLVMKYFPDERYEDYFVSLMTSSVVEICKEIR